jgi:ribosomal protein S6--L-glutamate ligase
MKVGMLMVRHPKKRQSPIMAGVVEQLRERGADVDVIYPHDEVISLADLEVAHDLYVLKAKTELALSMAGALHGLGAAMVNSYPVTVAMRDKIITTRILQTTDVPIPETYMADRIEQFAPLLEAGPLVVKPYKGSQGQGVEVVYDVDQLMQINGKTGPLFAQRYYQPSGLDHKIYCIGEEIFGVRRVWPARTLEEKLGESFAITPELREITLRCGQAFGIDLFGLDVVISDGRPYVVDISSFPGFKGVPDAARRLADYIYSAAHRAPPARDLVPTAATVE